MSKPMIIPLPQRGLLRIAGEDARGFLQGIVTADLDQVSETQARWSAFLTAQGKYLYDFFLIEHQGAILLEGEAERLADLKKRLSLYKLRSKVTVEGPLEGAKVFAVLDGAVSPEGALVFADLRHEKMGKRAILLSGEAPQSNGTLQDYDALRIPLGIPDGSRDLEVERTILLEAGFDELGGVDWAKGCFLGQELTARTKYRALIKKRLIPLLFEGSAPAPGTPVMAADKEVGVLRSTCGPHALALLRLEALEKPLTAGGVAGQARPAAWMKLS